MKTTRYVGKVIDDRIFLICENDKGDKIQVPHIDLMLRYGLTAVAYHSGTPKQPYKFLTTFELAMFLSGKDINGKVLKTPEQLEQEHQQRMAELMQDPEFVSMYNEVMKLRGAR